jgi:hypothetical protein
MNQTFVRPFREGDFEKLITWANRNPAWDKSILKYPTSFALVAFNKDGTLGFLPVQQAMVMEAMGFHPLATDPQKALVMKELTHALITRCYASGMGEIYFLGSDAATNEFAEHQGFTRMEWPVYRVRLGDLEAGGGNNGKP